MTVPISDVRVSAQAEQPLRDQIAATIHRVDIDHNGCPSADAITADPGRRPADPIPVSDLTGVQRVSACRYEVNDPYRPTASPSSLLSSIQLVDESAAQAIAAVAAAAEGGGPDSPETCATEVSYGDEVVVLRITSDRGESRVHLRYSGCDHNGLDDGVTVRRLTAPAVRPFLAGANRIFTLMGGGKESLLLDPVGP